MKGEGSLVNNEALSKTFLTFAEKECKGSSLLYEYLSIKISKDDELLTICKNAGEGISLLSKFVDKIPEDSVICIFHTHVANQIPFEMKKQLLQIVEDIGRNRDVFHIYNNIQDRYLHLDYYLDGIESKSTIAETDGHGRWFEWFLKRQIPIQ